ncbi:hypothetical protein LguiB_008938 [Lonicera macranthoides]
MKSLWKSNRNTSPPAIEMVSLHSPSPPMEEEEEIANLVVDHPPQSLFSSFNRFNFSMSKTTTLFQFLLDPFSSYSSFESGQLMLLLRYTFSLVLFADYDPLPCPALPPQILSRFALLFGLPGHFLEQIMLGSTPLLLLSSLPSLILLGTRSRFLPLHAAPLTSLYSCPFCCCNAERAIGAVVEAWDLVTDFFISEEVPLSIEEWDSVKGELSLVEFIYSQPNEFRECLKKGIPKQVRL